MKRLIYFYFRHKKLCLLLVGLFVVAASFAKFHTAFAAEDTSNATTNEILNDINLIFSQMLRISSAWLWPVLLMIGSLLDNDLIFGGAMGERLLSVWVQIRNLVNIIFVLVLLAIAVYNVLGLGEEGGAALAFKTVMPRFVLALIAVNFSFLAVKVVLDFTNVITGAVFALPTTSISRQYNLSQEAESTICGGSSVEVPMKALWCNNEKKFNDRANSFFSRLDRSNIAVAYALRFGRAPQLKFIRDGLKGIGQLGFNIIFNTVLYVVYALSFIALFLVLLSRVVALWIAVVLSPVIAAGIILPNIMGKLTSGASGLQEKFVKSAIAPITIGLVLSVGYIMLDGFEVDKSIHGSLLSSVTLDSVDPNALPTDIGDLQQLMIAIGVVVIVWTGVFGAAKGTFAEKATDFIQGHAESFGKFMAKLPTLLQAIPTKGGKRTLMQMLKTPGAIMQKFEHDRGTPDISKDMRYRVDRFRQDAQTVTGPGDAKKGADFFVRDPAVITDPNGRSEFAGMARRASDEGLAKFVEDNKHSHQDIIDYISTNGGTLASEIKSKMGNPSEFIQKINRESGTTSGAKAPASKDPKQAVRESVKNGSAKAGEGSFTGWNDTEFNSFKSVVEKIPDALIEVKDGIVQKNLPELQAGAKLMEVLSKAKNAAEVEAALNDAKGAGLSDIGKRELVINAASFTDDKLRGHALTKSKTM